MEIEPRWETNPATTPREELGMVSPELLWLRHYRWPFGGTASPASGPCAGKAAWVSGRQRASRGPGTRSRKLCPEVTSAFPLVLV